MKKLLSIFLLLTLICACVCGVSAVAYAEETPEPAIETENETTENLSVIKEKLNALMAKYNSEIETGKNFFKTRILPALIAGGLSTFIGLIFGGKARKNKKEYLSKYNEVAIAYNEQEKRVNDLIADKEQQQNYIEKLQAENTELKQKLLENAEIKEKLADIENKQDRFIAGANQAWAENPEATRALNKV